MRLVIYMVLALAILSMVGAGVYRVKKWGADEVRAEWAAADEAARKAEAAKGAAASTGLEVDRASRQVVYRTITQTVEKLVERPVYRNVCLDPDGLRLARCAILGQGADTCKPPAAVSTPGSAGGWDRSLSLALDRGDSSELLGLRR